MDKLKPEELAQVNTLRSKLKSTAGDIKAIAEQGRLISSDGSQLFLFKGMYKELKPYFDAFNNSWDKLVELFSLVGVSGVFPNENEQALQQRAKRYYFEACAIYEQHMNPTPIPTPREGSAGLHSALNDSRSVRARLPQINLPGFDGTQSDWPLFRDTFKSLVHEEPTISDIEKFHFLVSCVRGPALSLIKGVSLQESNYHQAWKLLNDNFNDKRRLATGYLKTVLNYIPFRAKPTANSLKHLLSTVIGSIESFKQLELVDSADFILTYLVLRCLDPMTRRDFEKSVSSLEFPKFINIVDFLKGEWKSLDLTSEEYKSQPSKHESSSVRSSPSFKKYDTSLFADDEGSNSSGQSQFKLHSRSKSNTPTIVCPICKASHSLYHCNKFKVSPAAEKRALLKNWNGCTNCLSGKHRVANCQSTRRCQTCNGKHHSWLHISQADTTPAAEESTTKASVSLSGTSISGEVILGTALVKIKDAKGKYQTIRLVTDCGSQHSFITRECVERLGLPFTPLAPAIAGIGQIQLPQTYGVLTCHLRPRLGRGEFSTDAIVVQDITGRLPHTRLPKALHSHLRVFELADPTYWKPQAIDFLLGADLYFDLVTGAPLQIHPNFPRLIPTSLGHIVAGRCGLPNSKFEGVSLLVKTEPDMQHIMNKFWEVEELPKATLMSEEEIACEEHFQSTHYRLPSGRYVVALPFKSTIHQLENPKQQVISRFSNLEYKLGRRPDLKLEYHQFMEEYIKLGHMQLAQDPTKYLIPHHCVSKMEEGKPKLRVVFDASCCSSAGSLNDHLLVGRKLQRDIADIILIFRTYKVVLVADIVKMYRQILVRPDDRPYQHILWRSNPEDSIQTFQLNTVTYGEASSSFLAIRSLLQLAKDEGHRYPRAARVLENSIYVDDIVSGASSLEDASILQDELIHLLQLGGFELSKWKSNCPEILDRVNGAKGEKTLCLTGDDEVGCKILGLQWNSSHDMLKFEVQKPTSPKTKRGILSVIARIYDPLGFIAPVVFMAKTILQDIWNANCDWDQSIPYEIEKTWGSFSNELSVISELKISRHVTLSEPSEYSIMGFSDASQRGYAAVIYLRVSSNTLTRVHLLRSKTKLAPTKLISIPRLELCGALLLARLLSSCKFLLEELHVNQVHLFTDSTIVLGWLKLPLNRLKAFVAHRISEILDLTPVSSWHHVSSEFNPADCASRGLKPTDLKDHPLWWTGPSWLCLPSPYWPMSSVNHAFSDLPEVKPVVTTSLLVQESTPTLIDWMSRSSSYLKLVRSLCYALRFIRRARRQDASKQIISLSDMEEATALCIRLVQDHYFTTNKQLLSSKTWKSLTSFKDERGLFRVGGRLQNSNLTYSAKHPIILPNCHFTKLLIDHYHRIHLHVGANTLQAVLQNRYYICSARKIIRSRVRHCVTCQMIAPKPQIPLMGDLPACRLQEGQIFQNVGIDLGGPFSLKESRRRNASLGKAYLCLFVCLVTKAVHLEVVSCCSTEAFLATMNRFIARRGRPRHVYSDCGTNFVGAASVLKDLYIWYTSRDTQQQIYSYAADQEIQWHFNPPRAPHFGGLWEAGIKSAKTLLAKNLGRTPLTFEEMSTLFCRIEAVLNSRPLCPLQSDPEAMECLTPGHFLIGRPLTAPPEDSLMEVRESTLSRWQLVQQRVQHFWKLWRAVYLNQLQQRLKWTSHHPNLKEGDLVIIKDSNCPPTVWPLGRVISTNPGLDGIVRVVTIRTSKGTYKRPVAKIVPLRLPEHDNSI